MSCLRFCAVSAAIGLTLSPNLSHAALVTGDIAFVGFNSDGDDDFAIVVLTDILNETIFFSDNEPGAGLGGGTSSEGVLRWDSGPSPIAAGSVITFMDTDSGSNGLFGATQGTLSVADPSVNLTATGDALYAYQGVDALTPSTYLSAIANDDFGLSTTGSLTTTGLVEGSTAIAFSTTTRDGGVYAGPRSGLAGFSDYRTLIHDPANWITEVSDGEALLPLDATSFSVAAVPEPSSWGAFVAIATVVAARRRRRAA